MRDKPWFAIIFMFVITAFFSSILIGFSRITRGLVDANRRLAFEKAVLAVLPVNLPDNATNQQLHQAFINDITPPRADSGGAYLLIKDNILQGYALPIAGQGFWAPIKGIIGIKPDHKTIAAIAFYEQNETPGLGAEITRIEFRRQFVGKVISSSDRPLALRPVTAELGPSEVHAITGATQTSNRLEKLINDDLIEWRHTLDVQEEVSP